MITTEAIEEITQLLVGKFNPEKIILLGSHASGRADEESDIDLLVVADTNLPPQDRFPEASRLLGDYPYAFDVIIKTPEEYRRYRKAVNHIVYFADKYGQALYERRNGTLYGLKTASAY